MVRGDLTLTAHNHIHFNAGTACYPEVIAVSPAASLCPTDRSDAVNAALPLRVFSARATGGQPPLHLGSGRQRLRVRTPTGKATQRDSRHCYSLSSRKDADKMLTLTVLVLDDF